MNLSLRTFGVTLSLFAFLAAPIASQAAGGGNAFSENPLSYGGQLETAADGSVHLRFMGVTSRSFQDSDSGKPEILDYAIQWNNPRYVYFSVRLDQSTPSYAESYNSGGPFITKLYRYDLEKARLTRIYREDNGSGYYFLGFDGNKLLLYPAVYGDNSPGPCWLEEVMAQGTELKYLNVDRPAQGIKNYAASRKFKAAKQKALQACQGEVYGEQP